MDALNHINFAWVVVAIVVTAAVIFAIEWARGRRP